MSRLMDILKELNKQQIRMRKFRMVNEDSNDLEFEFTPDQFEKINSIVKNLGGDLSPLVSETLSEAPTQFDFQKSSIPDLEKYIQDKLDKSSRDKKKDELLDTMVNKYGDETIKSIHDKIKNKKKSELSKEDLSTYKKFIETQMDKIQKKLKKERSNIKVAIDPTIIEKTKEYITQSSDALNWYHDVHDSVMDQFGESEGTLFLILLAILSPRNKLSDNLELASKIYVAVQEDISDGESLNALKNLFKNKNTDEIVKLITSPKRQVRRDYAKTHGDSKLVAVVDKYDKGISLNKSEKEMYDTFFEKHGKNIYNATLDVMKSSDENIINTRVFRLIAHAGMGMLSTYGKNLVQVLERFVDNGMVFSKTETIQELEKYWSETGVLDKQGTPISAEKVFSFTLNLLDPRYETLKKWNPVTIDTWMLLFFYPDLKKAERENLLKVPGVYVYLSRQIENMASQIKTADGKSINALQLQALIWVSIIKEVNKNNPNYATKFEDVINKKIENIEIIETNLKQINDFFDSAANKIESERMNIKSAVEKLGGVKPKYFS